VAFFLRRSLLYIKEDKIRESIFRNWGRPPPTRFYMVGGGMGEIEKAVAGYSQGYRKGKWLAKLLL